LKHTTPPAISKRTTPSSKVWAARAPYFHNGAAANLGELVNFYNLRFQMNLTDKERRQLVAFLNSL